jgi:hypothetical protein
METAEAVARLSLDNSPYKQGLAQAEQAMDKFSANIGHGLKDLGKMFAGAFAFEKIIGGFERSISEGAKFADLATRFGISASSIQKLGNAASLSGASVEDVASAMNKLAKNAGSAIGGNQKLQQTFQEIGLSVDDLVKMTPEQLFLKLSEAIHSGSLGSRDFAVAMELAGKNASVLMEVLRSGPEDIEKVGMSMGVMSDQTTESLKKAEDAIKKFNTIATVGFGTVLAAFMDIVAALKENPLHFFDQDALEKDIERMHSAEAAAKKAAMSRTLGGDAEVGSETSGVDGARKTKANKTQDAIDKGIESAYKIEAQFENKQIDYQRKEADRIAKLQEDRADQAEEDKKKEQERKNKAAGEYQDMISQAQNEYYNAAQQKSRAQATNIEAQGNASTIASGLGGSLRGVGQKMTSFEYGANKAVERAFQQAQRQEAQNYKERVRSELQAKGDPSDNDAVNRELVKRRTDQAEQQAKAPFDAAKASQEALDSIIEYMGDVQTLLNQLTTNVYVQ